MVPVVSFCLFVQEAIYKNYTSIKLKPERFSEYLLNTVGFCKREVIGLPFNPSKGKDTVVILLDSLIQGQGQVLCRRLNPLGPTPEDRTAVTACTSAVLGGMKAVLHKLVPRTNHTVRGTGCRFALFCW